MSEDSQQEQDFGAILAAFEREQEDAPRGEDPKPGQKVKGTVLSVTEDTAFVDLGTKAEGMVATAELLDEDGDLTVEEGDQVEALVTGRDPDSGCFILRVRPGRGEAARSELAQAYQHGIAVEGRVTGTNKGGAEVEVAGIRAFCPVSQLDLRYVEDPATYVGRRLNFRIIRYQDSGRDGKPDVVLSRRVLLEEEEKQRAEEARSRLSEGAVVKGKVTSITSYGAFVDLGGLEGLLHVSEIGHARVSHPEDVLSEGQVVEVKILSIEERENRKGEREERISLSMKALERDPWKEIGERLPVGTRTRGRVTRLEPFGAFVEIEPGIEGLVHVSELGADRHVAHAREVVELGEELEVQVLRVEEDKRKIGLSRVLQPASLSEEALAEYAPERGSGGFGTLGEIFRKQQGEAEED